jgi:hypothetical protein
MKGQFKAQTLAASYPANRMLGVDAVVAFAAFEGRCAVQMIARSPARNGTTLGRDCILGRCWSAHTHRRKLVARR